MKRDNFNMIGFGCECGKNIIFCSNEYSSSTSFAIITMNDIFVREKFLIND